ncbi:MAG TPA: hypothetical protein PLV50_15110, partial [Smithella sp.]|nr:hypothetical protein [Smithella sp.]
MHSACNNVTPTSPVGAACPPGTSGVRHCARRRSAMALSASLPAKTSAVNNPAFCSGAIFTRTPSYPSVLNDVHKVDEFVKSHDGDDEVKSSR